MDFVEGNPADAERIAIGAVACSRDFESALVAGDFDRAYSLLTPSTRQWMPLNRMISDHKQGVTRVGEGLPLSFEIRAIRRIYADAESRKEANSKGAWPPKMPKEAKRATIETYMVTTDNPSLVRTSPGGCWSFLWIAEEAPGEFGVAKFNYYMMGD